MHRHTDLLAAFAICQWARLSWPVPDVVIAMPSVQKIAKDFAKMIQKPFANIIRQEEDDVEAVEAGQMILLIGGEHSLEEYQDAIRRLSGTFLKRGYLLSLFP